MTRGAYWGLALMALPAAAQWDRPPAAGGRIASLGQPRQYHFHLGLAAGPLVENGLAAMMLRAQASITRDLASPVIGALSTSLEVYGGMRDAVGDGGARAFLRIPYFSVGAGGDLNLRDQRVDFVVTAHSPIRRGGVIARGGQVRADWYPARSHSFTLGFSIPVGEPLVGRGRPRRDYVVVSGDFQADIDYAVHDPATSALLDSLGVSADWIRRFVAPFLDHDGRRTHIAEARSRRSLTALRDRLAYRTVDEEVRWFHAAVDRAFALAAGDTAAGRTLGARAREVILDEILLPYNRLLGMKKRGDALRDLSTVARGRFARGVVADGLASPGRTDRVLAVFQGLTNVLDDVRQAASDEWDDPRLVWLPLQLALAPEAHDEPHELDDLLARATGVPWREDNRVRYLANLQFHWELLRMIRETQHYHVLWIHDFPAVTNGMLDQASLEQVVDGYLTTLAERVEAYDSTGTLPSFFIFLDQHYYDGRHSRRLMNVLEDPLRASFDPPAGGEYAGLRRAQERLHLAVRQSRVLQAEARQYGDAWLRNRVSVHVNITNRPDASFWSGSLISSVFGYPDNIMRDHRKVAFRDATEANPSSGVAIFTGMGVGSQYLGPTWDDRSLIVQGPLLLDLRQAARELLLSQGLSADAIPLPLREGAVDGPWPRPVALWGTAAMLLVNGTGYLPKPLNVGKALLYSLAPAGTRFKIPDSLWNSTFFGGLLVGACLRGATVSIIAPATTNAPSAGFPQLTRAHELYVRLLMTREILAEALASVGGHLHAGLYALPGDTEGFASRSALWSEQVGRDVTVRRLMPFAADLTAVAQAHGRVLPTDGERPPQEPPRLHAKVQVMVTADLWDHLRTADAWPAFFETYLRYREATYAAGQAARVPDDLVTELDRLAREVMGARAGGAWAVVGSQNQDYRGMFMDGEFGVAYRGAAALVPLMDLAFMEGTVTWIADRATLDRLLPPAGEMGRRFARVSKDAL